MKPLAGQIKTKGALKKVKPNPSDNSAKWSPLFFEHVDSLYLESPLS